VPRFLIAEEISSLRAVKSDCEEDMPMRNTGAKILVVDDERAIASTLATILQTQGYETPVAFSGEEAARSIQRRRSRSSGQFVPAQLHRE
jgi:PleD family two-component response regulator